MILTETALHAMELPQVPFKKQYAKILLHIDSLCCTPISPLFLKARKDGTVCLPWTRNRCLTLTITWDMKDECTIVC